MFVACEGTSAHRTVIDIAATVKKHVAIVPNLLAAHALSGCDTVACLHGIGKVSVMNTLTKGYTLNHISYPNSDFKLVIGEATSFIASCYGVKSTESMSDVRLEVWMVKSSKRHITKPP